MRYGHFDDAAKEYAIETPATPLPWINYLGNEDFFSLISNTGGGYSFYKDAKLRRITRYRYNNVPDDNGSRCYYLSLMDSADADAKPIETWSPTFLPAKTPLDSYRCRQGIGYTVFESSKRGIESKLTAFVPLHTNAEINRLDVTNTTDSPVVIDATASVEWCLWNAVDDSSNFQRNLSTGEVEIERESDATLLYHKTEFKERRNHYAFFAVNSPVIGFDTSRDEFLGQFNGWDTPQVIAEGKAHDSVAHGWFPIAANRVRLELQPGETKSLVFVLGYIEVAKDQKWEDPNDPAKVGIINKKPAHELFRRFATVEQVEAALSELNAYWTELLSTYSVESGDEELDRMVNIWHQYQCMVTFNMSRSASYYESGMGRGMGFRDSNQDLLGFVHLVPQRARQRIIDIASTQMEDGSAWHQYQPLTKKGNADIGGGFNDDPLWLVAGTYAYLAETGDTSILTEPVPFNNVEGSEVPLLEHLRRSVNFTVTHKGPHGLPLIGRADWNDCLNLNCFSDTPGESFQTVENNDTGVAESVFIGGMFVLYGGQYADIIEHYGEASGMTGAQAAEAVLRYNGVSGVRIEYVSGKLTDHFDPRSNVIRLSSAVYSSTSVASIGVAAHEAGHAVQYAIGYAPIKLRAAIIPLTQFGSMAAMPLLILGLILNTSTLVTIGIAAFGLSTLFQLLTLPVELDASRRALQTIQQNGLLTADEYPMAKKTLTAAALTYVAALATSLAQLLRLVLIFGGRDRNDR